MEQKTLHLIEQLSQLVKKIPLREDHPYSWDDIHACRKAFISSLIAVEDTGANVRTPLKSIGTSFGYNFGYDGLNEVDLRSRLAQFWLNICPALDYKAKHVHDATSRRPGKIRLGVFSEFLYGHTVGLFCHDLIENIDRTFFEVIIFYPENIKRDSLFPSFIDVSDQAIQVPFTIGGARKIIEGQQLDILFYPEIGMGPLAYYLALSRLAFIQCTTWGHPVTTGMPYMDYFLSSHLVEPEDAQAHYTEKLILLNELPTTLAKPTGSLGDQATREYFDLPEKGTLYMCPQFSFKIHPEFDDYIKGILERDKNGFFIMNDRGPRQKMSDLMARFERHLGAELCKRILFTPSIRQHEFLDFISLADVLLDPLHFGSGRGGYEAMVAGTPLITQPGEFMRGRVVLGLYKKMGVEDCIAYNKETYIEKAVEIANDKSKRAAISKALKSKADVLFNPSNVCREIEEFFKKTFRAMM